MSRKQFIRTFSEYNQRKSYCKMVFTIDILSRGHHFSKTELSSIGSAPKETTVAATEFPCPFYKNGPT